jgi:hypothetical protein
MENCQHTYTIYSNEYTEICQVCGLETPVAYNIDHSMTINAYESHCPFSKGYSRLTRFTRMLCSIIHPCPQHFDDRMLKYLDEHQPYPTQEKLMERMKMAPIKDKRYCSVHLYCKLFVENYEPPALPSNIKEIETQITNHFKDIEFAHHKHGEPFFNYMWLLNVCLEKWNLQPYLQFTKSLKCKKRKQLYSDMYDFCMNIILSNIERQLLDYS